MVTVGDASTSSPLSSALISPGSLPAEISLNWEDLEATYAADKSFEAAYARAATTIGAWRKVCNRGLEIQNFGTLASELMDECLGLFSGEHVAVEKRKGELKSLGLTQTGSKADLIERLEGARAQGLKPTVESDDDDRISKYQSLSLKSTLLNRFLYTTPLRHRTFLCILSFFLNK